MEATVIPRHGAVGGALGKCHLEADKTNPNPFWCPERATPSQGTESSVMLSLHCYRSIKSKSGCPDMPLL